AGIRFLMRSLKRDSVFVDVGAHLGYFSVIAASVAAKVFAIEPLEFLIQRIHRNAMANHRDNVSTIFAAVGETPGLVAMPKTGSASSSLDNESQHFVPMIRLDDYFAGDTLPTHLKIDTEGFEYQVLQGARRILESRPVILMEVHEAMDKFGHTRSDLYHLLADELGYEVSYARHRARNAKFARANVDAMAKFNDMMIICQPK
ncbi:MAG: FkbM family methyltransferase, partial [Pseudomonadota bacterium]